MISYRAILVCATLPFAAPPALARDPEKLENRTTERRRLYERVEEDVDRGRGRIIDEQTYQARQYQEERDERLGRIPRQREFDRFQEEHDRRQRLDARKQRVRSAQREAESPSRAPQPPSRIVVTPPQAAIVSPLARFVAEQEQLLAAARERYQDDLRKAEAERDEAIRAAKTRRARAQASRRFEERRFELTREYQAYRRKVLCAE